MEAWRQFLEELGDRTQVFVIGPMMNRVFVPTGPSIYVDGGTQFRPQGESRERFPTIAIGDGDSSPSNLDVLLPKDKDFSDLAFVFNSLPPTVRHVELLGFLGGRRDHELINFGETNRFLAGKKTFTTVRFEQSVVAFAGGSLKLDIKGTFSLAVLEHAKLRITGACRFPLNKPTDIGPATSLGLSNVGQGTVVFECSKPCFLFLS